MSQLNYSISKENPADSLEDSTEANTADLYKSLPRFLTEDECQSNSIKDQTLKPVEKTIELNGEAFQFFIMPAFVRDETEDYSRYESRLPGVQEAAVETAIIEIAVQQADVSFFDGEKKFVFNLNHLQNHLAAKNQHFNRKQIARSVQMLSLTNYVLRRNDTEWIFKSIEILAIRDEDHDIQFSAYFGDLISDRIRKRKLTKSK